MGKETVKIILTESKAINGKVRKAGIILLEGICARGITADSLNKAIQLKQARVEVVTKDEGASDGAKE